MMKTKNAKEKGLNKAHVGRHLVAWSKGTSEIALYRISRKPDNSGTTDAKKAVGLGSHDMRRLSLHVKWMIRDWVRLNTKQIIEAAVEQKADLIVLESMRGFKPPGYDDPKIEKKRMKAFFAYGIIRRKVKEKAVELGMRVVTVPYLKSSQHCALCGKEQQDKDRWKKNKNGNNKEKKKIFECERSKCSHEKCAHKCDPDENAARVLVYCP